MPRKRRLQKSYVELFRDPSTLFETARVMLFPNGEPEIWIQGSGGKGFRIVAGEGPAGLSLQISTFIGSPPITISGNAAVTYDPITDIADARHVSLCQYNGDDRSMAFKEWYQGRAEHPPT